MKHDANKIESFDIKCCYMTKPKKIEITKTCL